MSCTVYCSSNGTGTSLVLHTHSGGRVVHSYGRLIPDQFPITHPHQISYLIKEGLHGYRVTCNVSRPPPRRFYTPNGTFRTGVVTQENNQHSAILDVNISTFQNRDMYCDDNDTNYFYLYLTSSDNSECTPYHFTFHVISSSVIHGQSYILQSLDHINFVCFCYRNLQHTTSADRVPMLVGF